MRHIAHRQGHMTSEKGENLVKNEGDIPGTPVVTLLTLLTTLSFFWGVNKVNKVNEVLTLRGAFGNFLFFYQDSQFHRRT